MKRPDRACAEGDTEFRVQSAEYSFIMSANILNRLYIHYII